LARTTSHPSEQAPAGEPFFGSVSPASRLDKSRSLRHPRLPASAVGGARGFRPEDLPPRAPPPPRPRKASDSGSPDSPSSPARRPSTLARRPGLRLRPEGLRLPPGLAPGIAADYPSCRSPPGSSYVLAPIRFGLPACADLPPPVGQTRAPGLPPTGQINPTPRDSILAFNRSSCSPRPALCYRPLPAFSPSSCDAESDLARAPDAAPTGTQI
jgi:hypothetical protein